MATEGWVSPPNVRGTLDILWTCLQTTGLCAWTSICVNVPAPGDEALGLFRDKLHFTLLTLLGPELVFLLSYLQLQSARDSVQQFKSAGFADWTLAHAFYADMGGIKVQPGSWKSFPVNAEQLFYLVKHGYMDFPGIPLKEITSRGKSDGLSR